MRKEVLVSVELGGNAVPELRTAIQALCDPGTVWINDGVIYSPRDAFPGQVPDGTSVIHGPFRQDSFDGLFSSVARVGWMEDPISRMLRTWEAHGGKSPDGLCAFAERPDIRDAVLWRMWGRQIRDFDFVGLLEDWEDSLQCFSRRFARPVEESLPAAPKPPAFADTLDEATRGTLRILLEDEFLVYEAARDSLRAAKDGRSMQETPPTRPHPVHPIVAEHRPDDPVWISVHIPKTAGTSFRAILEQIFGYQLWSNYGTIFTREEADPARIPRATRCIHGHFLANAFDGLFPSLKRLIWVRDPVDRIVSNFSHFKRNPSQDPDNPVACAVTQKNLDLLGYARLEDVRNEMTRYFAGKSYDDFDFVGVVERFEESLSRLPGELADNLEEISSLPRLNVNPDRDGEEYPLTNSERDEIRRLNEDDCNLYAGICSRFGG